MFEINRFGKVEIFSYSAWGDEFFNKMNFDYPKNTISIVQFSPFAAGSDRIILEPTNVDMIHWALEIDGVKSDVEEITGVKTIDYINSLYSDLHLGIVNNNGDSSSSPPSNTYQFDEPISIDANGNLIIMSTIPLGGVPFRIFAKTAMNPNVDLNGLDYSGVPNHLVKIETISSGNIQLPLPSMSFEDGYTYNDLVGLQLRIAFYNRKTLSWIYSNVVVVPEV